MRDDEFEWDDRKARRNVRDHGFTFEQARLAFDDPDSIDRLDPDPDERLIEREPEVAKASAAESVD